jgi:hypothetical protein
MHFSILEDQDLAHGFPHTPVHRDSVGGDQAIDDGDNSGGDNGVVGVTSCH